MLPPDYKPCEKSFCKLEGTKLWFSFYREMAQRLRARSAFPDHQDSIPRAHMEAHTLSVPPVPSDAFSCSLWETHPCSAKTYMEAELPGIYNKSFMEKTLRAEIFLDGEK